MKYTIDSVSDEFMKITFGMGRDLNYENYQCIRDISKSLSIEFPPSNHPHGGYHNLYEAAEEEQSAWCVSEFGELRHVVFKLDKPNEADLIESILIEHKLKSA